MNLDKLSGNDTWLLDSGISCHMTRNKDLLHNIYEIELIPINLPNGTQALATKMGIVCVNSKTTLQDVLYVPELRCSLISIAQLIEDIYCTVTFTSKHCVIQDLSLIHI